MGIKKKLILAFLLASFIPAIVCVVAIMFSSRVINTYSLIADNNVPNLQAFINMKGSIIESQIPIANLVGEQTTKAQADEALADFRASMAKFNAGAKIYEAIPFAEGEAEVWEHYRDTVLKHYVELSEEMARLSGTGDKADLKTRDEMWKNEYAEAVKARKEGFETLVEFQTKQTKKTHDQAIVLASQMNWISAMLVAVGVLATLSLGYVIARTLSRQLDNVAEMLNESSTEVRAATGSLSDGSEKLAAASHQQAASVQETSAALEEISAMVDRNSSGAKESTRLSDQAKSKADEGKSAVSRVISAVEDIRESKERIKAQIDTSNEKVAKIATVIRDIGEKTKVINDIVFQTKLLSFNASVEAARAGEYGKGFAVVAEEVGNLAAMSGEAAKEISTLLDESIRQVEQVIRESKDSVVTLMSEVDGKVQTGTQVAESCSESLDEIVTNINLLSEAVQAIAVASSEQSSGVAEISKAMREIDTATQQNSSISEQTSAAAQQLTGEVSRVVDAVGILKALVDGSKAQAVTQNHQAPRHRSTGAPKKVPSAHHPAFDDSIEGSSTRKAS